MLRFSLIILLLFSTIFALQSQGIIRGKVIEDKGLPIIGAYIFHNDNSIHAHTNDLGIFTCDKSQIGDTIIVSYLGFESKIIIINQSHFKAEVEIVLQEKAFDLNQIIISNAVKSFNQLAQIDLETAPVNSSQEILRKVPGLIIGQHAGGGKAEQIFLRGFDIDHGTDVAISVDGMPVNMVSHAHGQGYADLHFLIPETIERLDFGKGPYYADKGNFNTAGYVAFQTKEKLERSSIGLEFGQFGHLRTVGMFNLLDKPKQQHAYLASEFILNDGPFESSQNFSRINLMGKYISVLPNDDRFSVLVSHFQSNWDASGQIPQRAVDAGLISRFGAIDDKEGGNTNRSNFSLHHTKNISNSTFLKSHVFFSHYEFELFSNFTFFLEDAENGDQIRQYEDRNIFGAETVLNQRFKTKFAEDLNLQFGVGLRHDVIQDNELSHTLNRQIILEKYAFGNVIESNFYGFLNADFDFGNWLINPSLRLDYFKFDYSDKLNNGYNRISENKCFAAPKLNIIFNPNHHFQFFLKTGMGYHSNDTRVVVAQNGQEVLPAAYGADLGTIWKPIRRLIFNAALWYLFLDQEFVYVGDAGIVEPSGKSRRLGLDAGLRYQINNWLFFNMDANYALARSINQPENANYIPLAPSLTANAGLAFKHPSGFSGAIRSRFVKDRPANETNSIIAEGYLITDLNLNYDWQNISIGFSVENLFNEAWNETQFATESRLANESESIEEIHFTPGVPFFLKGKIKYRF